MHCRRFFLTSASDNEKTMGFFWSYFTRSSASHSQYGLYGIWLCLCIIKQKSYLILGIKKGSNIKRIFLITFSMGNVDVTLLFHMDFFRLPGF